MKKQDLEKCIGVWLDHEKAYLIKPGKDEKDIETLFSNQHANSRIPGEESSGTRLGNNRSTNDEYSKHNKEQEHLKHYYKSLSEKLKTYDHIILLGASTAKNELGNLISKDKSFNSKTVETKNADHMTPNQMTARISELFS